MLRHSCASNRDVERAVERLLAEDTRFDDLERRSAHRDHLVRPLTVEFPDSGLRISGFSRNISGLGICLIAAQPVVERSVARLTVHRLADLPTVFLAECRWQKPFGSEWNISGWQFINIVQ